MSLSLKSNRQGGEGQAIAPPHAHRNRKRHSRLVRSRLPVPHAQKPSLPTLKVTGIAGEKGSPVHLAIVNGTSVVEGSLVNGAKVEKIMPDRVRFIFENHSFDVPLGQGDGTN